MIVVKVHCDGCLTTRKLPLTYHLDNQDIRREALSGGWAELPRGEHLCPECIKRAKAHKK